MWKPTHLRVGFHMVISIVVGDPFKLERQGAWMLVHLGIFVDAQNSNAPIATPPYKAGGE